MASSYRRGRHSVSDLKAHLVFVPKYRRNIFTAESLDLIRSAFDGVADKMGFHVLEFGGEADHVHVLLEYPPKLSISQLANHLKGVSSRLYRKQYPSPHADHLWSPSYFAVSVGGEPLEIIKQYINSQKPS